MTQQRGLTCAKKQEAIYFRTRDRCDHLRLALITLLQSPVTEARHPKVPAMVFASVVAADM